jgi:biotin-(acetyl-CoA carboxylase) ligase
MVRRITDVKKKDLMRALYVATSQTERLGRDVRDWAHRYNLQSVAIAERDAKIKTLIDSLTIATQALATAPEEE